MIITFKDNFDIEDIAKNFNFLYFRQKFLDILLLNIFDESTFLFSDDSEYIDIHSLDKSQYVYIKYDKSNHHNPKIYNFPFNSTYIEDFFNIRFSRLLYQLNEFIFVIKLNDISINIYNNKFISNEKLLSLDYDDLNSLFKFLLKNKNFDFAYELLTIRNDYINNDDQLDICLDILDSDHHDLTNIYFKDYTNLKLIIQTSYFEDYYFVIKNLKYFQDNKEEFLNFIFKNKNVLEHSFIEMVKNDTILDNF